MRSLLSLALLVGMTSTAGAQGVSPLAARLDAVTLQALTPALEAARRDSLPVRALEAKALEGSAKQIPGPQIVRAVERMGGELREARLLVMSPGGAAPSDELVIAATDARRRGVPANEVAALAHTSAPDGPLLMAMAVLGDLVQRGVPAGNALAAVTTILESGATVEALSDLPARMDIALRVGASPIDALGSATRGRGARPAQAGPPPAPPGRSDKAPGSRKK
jgi:hypothetical protein